MAEASGGSPGPSTDRHNDPVIDPTENVRELFQAAEKRADDLRELDAKWRDKLDTLRAKHASEMGNKESERLDAIRAVDVGNVQRAAEVQATQALALANQVIATANTLEQKLGATVAPLQTRIDDLTRVQYEGVGQKTSVVEGHAAGANVGLWVGLVFGALSLIIAISALALSVYFGTR